MIAILSWVPEFYPRLVAVLIGMGEMLVIAAGLGSGLFHLWRPRRIPVDHP